MVGKSKAGCKVLAHGVQHANTQCRVVVQPRIGLAQLAVHFGREAVALVGSVDADQQHAAAVLPNQCCLQDGWSS